MFEERMNGLGDDVPENCPHCGRHLDQVLTSDPPLCPACRGAVCLGSLDRLTKARAQRFSPSQEIRMAPLVGRASRELIHFQCETGRRANLLLLGRAEVAQLPAGSVAPGSAFILDGARVEAIDRDSFCLAVMSAEPHVA